MWMSRGAAVAAVFAATMVDQQVNRNQNLPKRDTTVSVVRDQSSPSHPPDNYQEAIRRSRELIRRYKEEVGAPGIVAGVSVNGLLIWREGFGYADLENMVPCTPDTVIRIASISKSLTMAAVAKLWEQGKLDIDKPVQHYVPSFPEKFVDGDKVTLTCRHLVSNMGGIRHYEKIPEKDRVKTEGTAKPTEMEQKEYYIKDNYATVGQALALFRDDPLHFKPGTQFLYSTHGWTLVAAIVEAVSQTPFTDHMTKMLKAFGMHHTYLDVNDDLIPHRARHYKKNKKGHVVNVPYVDNSYKWAGGGFLSTVADLLRFANVMLYSRQQPAQGAATTAKTGPSGYLSRETVESMWTPQPNAKVSWAGDGGAYGMGWAVTPTKQAAGMAGVQSGAVLHTGAAVGASSVVYIQLPRPGAWKDPSDDVVKPPLGIVVAIVTNLHDVRLHKLAADIAHIFDASRLSFFA